MSLSQLKGTLAKHQKEFELALAKCDGINPSKLKTEVDKHCEDMQRALQGSNPHDKTPSASPTKPRKRGRGRSDAVEPPPSTPPAAMGGSGSKLLITPSHNLSGQKLKVGGAGTLFRSS